MDPRREMSLIQVDMATKTRWTEHEDKDLVEMVSEGFSVPKISKQIGRSVASVRGRMVTLGLKTRWDKDRAWSRHEVEYLQGHLDLTLNEIAEHLGRSKSSVQMKMRNLGVDCRRQYRRHRWTKDQDARLESLLDSMTVEETAKELGLSYTQVKNRMRTLSLKSKHRMSKFGTKISARSWDREESMAVLTSIETKSAKEIAKSLGRSPRSIYQHLSRNDIQARQGKVTVRGLAQELGVADSTIRNYRDRLGLRFRKKSARGASPRDIVLICEAMLSEGNSLNVPAKKIREVRDSYLQLTKEVDR